MDLLAETSRLYLSKAVGNCYFAISQRSDGVERRPATFFIVEFRELSIGGPSGHFGRGLLPIIDATGL